MSTQTEGGGDGLAVQLGNLPAEDRDDQAERRDRRVVGPEDPPAHARRESVDQQVDCEVRAARDPDRGADEGHPAERVLADFLHPEEIDTRQVEARGQLRHHVTEEDARQHVDHRDEHEDGDDELGDPGDPAEARQRADRTGARRALSSRELLDIVRQKGRDRRRRRAR